MKILTFEQGSPEWLAARAGFATASRFKDILANGRGGKPSATRESYMVELVVERLTHLPYPSYVNGSMQHGTETEPLGRQAYEVATGAIVDQVGMCQHDSLMVSCSPDGLIDTDGGLEIKCPYNSARHLDARRGMPPEHTAQVQGCLWVTGRQWWDFVSFDPRMPEHLRLFVHRIERDESYITKLEAEVRRFLAEAEKMQEELSCSS